MKDPAVIIAIINGIGLIVVPWVTHRLTKKKYLAEVSRSNVETGSIVTDKIIEGSDWIERRMKLWIGDLEKRLEERNETIEELLEGQKKRDEEIKDLKKGHHELEERVNELEDIKNELKGELERKEGTIRRQEKVIKEQGIKITRLTDQLAQRDKEIETLKGA